MPLCLSLLTRRPLPRLLQAAGVTLPRALATLGTVLSAPCPLFTERSHSPWSRWYHPHRVWGLRGWNNLLKAPSLLSGRADVQIQVRLTPEPVCLISKRNRLYSVYSHLSQLTCRYTLSPWVLSKSKAKHTFFSMSPSCPLLHPRVWSPVPIHSVTQASSILHPLPSLLTSIQPLVDLSPGTSGLYSSPCPRWLPGLLPSHLTCLSSKFASSSLLHRAPECPFWKEHLLLEEFQGSC